MTMLRPFTMALVGVAALSSACASGGASPRKVSVESTPTVFIARVETAAWSDREIAGESQFRKVDYGVRELTIAHLSPDAAQVVRTETVRADEAGYIVHALAPGKYEIPSVFWGDKQSQCVWVCNGWKAVQSAGWEFNERVSRFEVVAGRVNYAGTLVLVNDVTQHTEKRGKENYVVTASKGRIDQLWDEVAVHRDLRLGRGDIDRVTHTRLVKLPARKRTTAP